MQKVVNMVFNCYICRMMLQSFNTDIDFNSIAGVLSPASYLIATCVGGASAFSRYNIGSFQPDTSISDYIEIKLKLGGQPLSWSMLQSIHYFIVRKVHAMFKKTTCDLMRFNNGLAENYVC